MGKPPIKAELLFCRKFTDSCNILRGKILKLNKAGEYFIMV